jgi:hypothetical protein
VPLPALAVQGEEAFRSLRARLYGHLESHSSFGQRHGPRRDCSKPAAHRQWVEIALRGELSARDAWWSEAVAVGSLAFVEKVKSELGIKALHRELEQVDGTHALRESGEITGDKLTAKTRLSDQKTHFKWERFTEVAGSWRGPTPTTPESNRRR